MKRSPTSFSSIILALGEKDLAGAIGAKPHQPRDWRIRNSIPPEWWGRVCAYAASIGQSEITVELFAHLAEVKSREAA